MDKKSQDKKSDQKALVPITKDLVPSEKGLVPTKNELKTEIEGGDEVALPEPPLPEELIWEDVFETDFGSEFTSPQVRKVFGIKKERLRQWIKRGYIQPSVRPSSGPGTDNIFSYSDIFSISLFKKMIDLGLNRWIASQWLPKLREKDWKAVRKGKVKYIIIRGDIDREKEWNESMKLFTVKELPRDLDSDDFILVMNLNKLMKNAEMEIARVVVQEDL